MSDLETMKSVVAGWTHEQAKEFLRKVTGPPKRELEDQEYDHVWTLLQLIDPISTSNNQSSESDVYQIGNTMYRVTYWPSRQVCDHWITVPPTIQVMLEEEETDE